MQQPTSLKTLSMLSNMATKRREEVSWYAFQQSTTISVFSFFSFLLNPYKYNYDFTVQIILYLLTKLREVV